MKWTLEEIIAAHPRIHTAEGCFYRDVLVDAAEAAGMEAVVISPKDIPLEAHAQRLAEIGKEVGRPWSKDERLAAVAAWLVLRRS